MWNVYYLTHINFFIQQVGINPKKLKFSFKKFIFLFWFAWWWWSLHFLCIFRSTSTIFSHPLRLIWIWYAFSLASDIKNMRQKYVTKCQYIGITIISYNDVVWWRMCESFGNISTICSMLVIGGVLDEGIDFKLL